MGEQLPLLQAQLVIVPLGDDDNTACTRAMGPDGSVWETWDMGAIWTEMLSPVKAQVDEHTEEL